MAMALVESRQAKTPTHELMQQVKLKSQGLRMSDLLHPRSSVGPSCVCAFGGAPDSVNVLRGMAPRKAFADVAAIMAYQADVEAFGSPFSSTNASSASSAPWLVLPCCMQ